MVNWKYQKIKKIGLNLKPFWYYKMSCTTKVEHIFSLIDHSNDGKLSHCVGQPNFRSKTWLHTHVEHSFRIKSGTTTTLSNIFLILEHNNICITYPHWLCKFQLKNIKKWAQPGLAPPYSTTFDHHLLKAL